MSQPVNGNPFTTAAAADLICGALTKPWLRKPENMLLAGYDEETGPSLYHIDQTASLDKIEKGAFSDGSYYSISKLETQFRRGMSLEEAIHLVDECISEIRSNVKAASPHYVIKLVDKDGAREYSWSRVDYDEARRYVASHLEAYDKEREQQRHQHKELGITLGADSSEEASHDDELKQKALSQAVDLHSEGNELYNLGKLEEALPKYELALQIAPDTPSSVSLRAVCHSNRAACLMRLEKYEDVIRECTKALEFYPEYLKALVRRGESHAMLGHLEEAIADMERILEIDPSDGRASKTLRTLRKKGLAGLCLGGPSFRPSPVVI